MNYHDENMNNEIFDDEDFELTEDSPKFKQIYKDDEKYIKEFELSLRQQGLSTRTIRNHTENIRFFLIDYLLFDESENMEEGIYSIPYFLGDWFIRKGSSSEYSIKQNITSIKKFYKCMLKKGNITKEGYETCLQILKEGKDQWSYNANQYDYDFEEWLDDYNNLTDLL